MELTGKNKEKFENWFNLKYKTNHVWCNYSFFNLFPISFKFGVYQEYFDSVDVHIGILLISVSASNSSGVRYDWFIYSEDNAV